MTLSNKTVPLGELGEIVSGSTPKTHLMEFWNGDIPWITPADLSDHQGVYFHGELRKITTAGYESCSTKMIPAGSIIFSSRAPIGHIAVTTFPLCTNQGFKSIVPNERLNPVYGYFALKYFTPQIEELGRGATFSEVSKDIIENFCIPLPPLPEQKGIAAILEKADRLRRLRRYALEIGETYLQSVFLEMFGDPATNPKHWKVSKLRSISIKFSDGPFGSNLKTSHYVEKGVRVIRLQNVGVGRLIDDDKAFISHDHFNKLLKHKCIPGDVIVGTLGDPNLRAFVLSDSIPYALNKADCVQIRPNPQKANALFLAWLLNMPQTLQLAYGLLHGQTRTRISMGQLAQLEVPIPPILEQEKFACIVKKYGSLRATQLEGSRQAEHLFQTLLHKVFKNQL